MEPENQSTLQSSPTQTPAQKPRKKILIAGAIGLIILIGLLLAFLFATQNQQKSPSGNGGNNDTANKFYTMLENSAKQGRLKIAMFRQTFATKADADSGQNAGSTQSSVSQVDDQAQKHANVYAFEVGGAGKGFRVGRCYDGKPYGVADAESNSTLTLQAAVDRLKQPLMPVEPRSVIDSCALIGVPPEAVADLAYARVSDGVMPVTLSGDQAKTWIESLKQYDMFIVKDEGSQERDGKQLKKISFTVKDEFKNNANSTLNGVFEDSVGFNAMPEHQKKAYRYAFLPINPGMTGSIEGYYLIDEKSNLPVYSELKGVNRDRDPGTPQAGRNIARTKQTYNFNPNDFISANTPLEILQ